MLWAALFSLSWLLPVHIPPWSTFPADAWSAIMMAIAALSLAIRTRSVLSWNGLSCLAASLVFLPWVQFSFGLLPFAGQAWVTSLYLLGFLLALLTGARWELHTSSQLAHGLFVAIGIAAIVSVGLQLYTWGGSGGELGASIWFPGAAGARPYANLGQPNQLATLLVWGLMALLWGQLHKVIGRAIAVFAAAFLLLGLALTQSRTGFLVLTVMLAAIWVWRRLWHSRAFSKVASGLYLYFLACPVLLRWISSVLLQPQSDIYSRLQQHGELRLGAWRLFAGAVLERPWFGYGWTEVSSAQMAVADQFPSLGGIFQQSHNLFLDFVLWSGLPLGLLVLAALIRWFWIRFGLVQRPEDAVLFMLLGAVGIHALVEFPLQYAYFLLPVGLVMGILDARSGIRPVAITPYWMLPGILLAAVSALCITIRDYAQVDNSYTMLRLEQSIIGQGRGPMGGPPNVWSLTQLREWIVGARLQAHPNMSQKELDEMAMVARAYPSLSLAYRLATALALNGRPAEARVWLDNICKFTDEAQCRLAKHTWEQESPKDPRTAAIKWPR
jgi:O-antigen ligase